jgi:hypothetical protein
MKSPRWFFALPLALLACSDSNGLPDPTLSNVERSETLYALVGTPVATPSGYSLDGSRRIRTDITDAFDFAYNIEPDGRHVFLPRAALGIDTSATLNPGFQRREAQSFEAITDAPSNGYITDQVVPVAVGDRFVVRSRIVCNIGVPKYGKLEVTNFDPVGKTVTFRVLINENCGFKGLEPGLPDR